MNKVMLIGWLTRDPELRFTAGSGTAVCTFTLAVDRNFKDKDGNKEADFISCVVWNKRAEMVANYVTKGRLVAVSGRIQTRTYEGNDGQKKYVTEVVADEVQFLERKDSGAASRPESTPGEIPDYEGDGFYPVDGNEDIPF
jgi:single-strand DNA-binding protein